MLHWPDSPLPKPTGPTQSQLFHQHRQHQVTCMRLRDGSPSERGEKHLLVGEDLSLPPPPRSPGWLGDKNCLGSGWGLQATSPTWGRGKRVGGVRESLSLGKSLGPAACGAPDSLSPLQVGLQAGLPDRAASTFQQAQSPGQPPPSSML